MAADTALKEPTQIDWARQLRGAQQDYRRRSDTSPNLRLVQNKPEQVVPFNQQNLQTLPMQLPGDAANFDQDITDDDENLDEEQMLDEEMELGDDDIEEMEDNQQNAQRQLAFSRLQAQRQQAAASINQETEKDNAQQAEQSQLMGAATAALDQAGESSATVKLLARLNPADDRNIKITGKIGFLVRVVLLAVGGLEFLTPIDKTMSVMFGGISVKNISNGANGQETKLSQEKKHEGEKKTDTLLTISLFLSMAMQLVIMLLPIIVIFALVGGVASAI